MEATSILQTAGSIVTTALTTTTEVVTALPFMILPIGFVFGRKLIGMVKNLTMQGRGRKR